MLVQSIAKLRYVSIPPKKMRLVGNMIKGMPVEKALGILNFTPRIAASHIAKTLKSAAANALHKEGTDNLKPEDLKIKDVVVGAAPTAKRIRFQSMGRVFRYRKRFCHLTITLEADVVEAEATKRKAKKTTKAKATDSKKEVKPKTVAKKKVATKKDGVAKKAKADTKAPKKSAAPKAAKPKAAAKAPKKVAKDKAAD
jgi:large subunit ribosomal protein L22